MSSKHAQLAKLHIAKKELLLTDDEYQQLLATHGASQKNGCYSASTMNHAQLDAIIETMISKGFIIKTHVKQGKRNRPQVKKLYAMWCNMHRIGVIKNKSFKSMVMWCQRQTPDCGDDLNLLTPIELNQLIEAMKLWRLNQEKLKT